MFFRGGFRFALAVGSAMAAAAQDIDAPPEFSEAERRMIIQHLREGPPPPDPTNRYSDDPRAAHFGQYLFFDPRLSRGDAVSCATCHQPERAFTDGRQIPEALGQGRRNTPSLLNAAWQRWYFWDGRADTLWGQTIHPIEDPDEMGNDRVSLVRRVYAEADLRAGYEGVFGQLPHEDWLDRLPPAACPPTIRRDAVLNAAWETIAPHDQYTINRIATNLGKALAAYQRQLITGESDFDRFARGLRDRDDSARDALSPTAQRGLQFFLGTGQCRLCHSGPNFSDGEFHNIFVPPRVRGGPLDAGRYAAIDPLRRDPFNAAGQFSDDRESEAGQLIEFIVNKPDNWGAMKTPSLRGAARTAPYMHAGQFASLAAVVRYYSTLEGAVQMGHHAHETILEPLNLDEPTQRDLLAFLESLNGSLPPEHLLRKPPTPLPTSDKPER